MKNVIQILLLCSFRLFVIVNANQKSDYIGKRQRFFKNEHDMSIGGNIVLDDDETKVNKMLMQWKFQEFDYAFQNPEYFNFTRNYFEYKDNIKRSKVYQFIKAMPKGAALHVHGSALLSPQYLLNITYKDNLYVCFEEEIKFKFARITPEQNCKYKWKLMKEVRNVSTNVEKFDSEIKNNFTLVNNSHESHDVNSIWKQFAKIFDTIYPLVSYKPVWIEYLYEALNEFRKDSVDYIEIRSGMPGLYDLNGHRYSRRDFVETSKQVVDRFVNDHPNFIGVKLIYSQYRNVDASVIRESVALTKEFKALMPEFIAGYDLIGQEDTGKPLIDFLPELYSANNSIEYYFHAGETNWYGTKIDENLVDAIILGTKRIGHAFALLKHPLVLHEVKSKDICLEINVLSNSVLGLVKDLRNHPLASFIAQGLPVVLSSDDPALWEADPLSTDFYVSFVGVASRWSDLRLLKQLALNSIRCSSLSAVKKKRAYDIFHGKWKIFIKDVLSSGHS